MKIENATKADIDQLTELRIAYILEDQHTVFTGTRQYLYRGV